MTSFSASLKTQGESKGLPATLELTEGRLSIAAGDAAIGDWSLDEIGLEPTEGGYRLEAEGEQLVLEIAETERFTDELSRLSKKSRKIPKLNGIPKPRLKKQRSREDDEKTAKTGGAAQGPAKLRRLERPADTPEPAPAEPPAPQARPKASPPGDEDAGKAAAASPPNGAVAFLDRLIDKTERRWGPLLPAWVFNRIVFVGAGLLVILAFIFRGFTSIVLVVTGVVALMLGGAAYTDDVLASKMLPGRATPTHLLMAGITLLVLGIFFGLIA